MSIHDLIEMRIEEGRLWRVEPVVEDDPIERCMVISSEIMDLVYGVWPDAKWARRCNRLRADLEAFVRGDVIGLCLKPYKADTAYMGRLDKPTDEVWDIRSRDPQPGLRVFGCFADRDCFVALLWSPRSVEIPYSQRLPLQDRNSAEWKQAVKETKSEWRKLFHPYNPIHGDTHDFYASRAFPVGDDRE
jgi:hypothetical protein